jgi:hypothetical protein
VALTLADLAAEPLPSASAADIRALNPDAWDEATHAQAWKPSRNGSGPDQGDPAKESVEAWICATPSKQETRSQRRIEREIACAQAIRHYWSRAVAFSEEGRSEPAADALAAARTLYAYALATLGAPSIGRISSALGAEPTTSDPGSRKSADDVIRTKGSASANDVYEAIGDAALANLDAYGDWGWAWWVMLGKPHSEKSPAGAVFRPWLDTCTHFPGTEPSSLPAGDNFTFVVNSLREQISACDSLLTSTWRAYQATGTDEAWKALVAVWRYASALPIKDCGGDVCRGEWMDLAKSFLLL